MKLAITGASGFVGRRLSEVAQARGHQVIALKRPTADRPWDLEGVDGVIHLAGEPVAEGRWTKAKMARIRDSRVFGTRAIVAAIARATPRVLVSASAVGFYGDRGNEELTEDSPPGNDFLADVCKEWEAEALKSPVRTVLIRAGIVLGPGGGALARMLTPFKLGLGGRLGSGRQWMSWIHRDDLVDLFLLAIERESLAGPLLGTAPRPVTNADFTKALGRALGRWTLLPMARWQMELIFGKVAEALCGSQKCRPRRAIESGFSFRHPDLDPALRQILADR
jgi:uncharacterized protein (TIGR01777 family)